MVGRNCGYRYTMMADIMSMSSLWPAANATRALELAQAGIALGYY